MRSSAAAATAEAPSARELRTGPGYWLHSFALMLRFDWGRARTWAPLMAVIQLMMGAGMAIMYGFFYPHVSQETALYIATGTPTLALIPLGLVMVPGGVSQQRIEGTFDFIWSLPSPRTAQAVSTFTLYTLLSLPGMVLALLVAVWRYGIHLSVSFAVVPAALVSALVAVTLGFGLALTIKSPIVMNLITNALIFMVLLFSPIVYPATNLPAWFQRVHEVLPFEHMANVIRAGLTDGLVTDVARSYAVLLAWIVVGCALTAAVVGRRR
ncbi:MAG: ABC transporter permease [Planctomycetaceae bacterium]